jgi:hypothetical protein
MDYQFTSFPSGGFPFPDSPISRGGGLQEFRKQGWEMRHFYLQPDLDLALMDSLSLKRVSQQKDVLSKRRVWRCIQVWDRKNRTGICHVMQTKLSPLPSSRPRDLTSLTSSHSQADVGQRVRSMC